MAPTIGDVVRITMHMVQALNEIQNVYHMLISGSAPPTSSNLRGQLKTLLQTAYDYIDYAVADNVDFAGFDVFNITQDEDYGFTAFTSPTSGGGGVNPMLPPQCAHLVLFPTSTPGSIGRKYLPPYTDNVLDDNGSPESGILGNAVSYADELLDGIDELPDWAGTFGNYRSDTDTFLPWNSAEVRDLIATQRRRYTGSGV